MTYPPAFRPSGPRTPREVMGSLAELLRDEYRLRVYGAAFKRPHVVAGVLSLPAGINVWLVGGTTLAWREGGYDRTWPARDVLGAAGQLANSVTLVYAEWAAGAR